MKVLFHQLMNLKYDITKIHKYFLNEGPISLVDEESVTLKELLVESKKVILKTHLNELTLLIEEKQQKI